MIRPGHGKFAVLGLGGFGSTVALELERMGNAVLGADRDEARVNAIADEIAQALVADVRDPKALGDMGVKDFDAVIVAIGEDLESNVLCTMGLKDEGVRQIWVKATSESHRRILSRMGVQRIINPEYEVGIHVANSLNYPFVLDYLNVGSHMLVAEVGIPADLAGKKLQDLGQDMLESLRFLAVVRSMKPLSGETTVIELAQGDRLIVMGSIEALQEFGRCL